MAVATTERDPIAKSLDYVRDNLPIFIFTPLFAVLVGLASGGRGQYITQLAIASLDTGPVAALSGVGLVLTYRATGVFNFAQGGVATVCAFTFYELAVRNKMPVFLAVIVAVLLMGPLIGLLLEALVFRPLQKRNASTSEKLVANLGVLVLMIAIPTIVFGLATQVDAVSVFSPKAFAVFGSKISLGGAELSTAAAANLLIVVVVSVGLAVLLRFTRLGTQIRAVVDRRQLAELSAIDANRVSQVAWVLGCSFAGMVGVLYAPLRGLTPYGVTLTVLETIAVAAIARLRSIPAAVFGGLFISLIQSLTAVFSRPRWPGFLSGIPSLPPSIGINLLVITLVAMLLIYRSLDEVGSVGSSGALVTGSFGGHRRSAAAKVPVVVVAGMAAFAPLLLQGKNLDTFTLIVAYSVTFLSIVAITGFSGHISLATSAFAGLGAYISVRLSNGYVPDIPFVPMPTSDVLPHVPVILATLIGGLLVVPLGVAVGFPALRRKGLILGLITLAFAQIVDRFEFNNLDAVGKGLKPVHRPSFAGLDLRGDVPFAYYALAILALTLLLTKNLRSGALGRVLGAMRDSENGAVSVGISLRRYKLFIFAASAFLGAVGGALIAEANQSLSYDDQTFNPLQGLFWFTAVVVAGLSYLSGAVIAAIIFIGIDAATGQNGSSLFFIGMIALFIGFFRGGLVGTLLRFYGGGKLEASLRARYVAELEAEQAALAAAEAEASSEVQADGLLLQPSPFAQKLLTKGKR